MKKEDLIKKLEKLDLPEIEIFSHKTKLKRTLIDWKYGQKEKLAWPIFVLPTKQLAYAGVLAIVFVVFATFSNLFFPEDTLAKAKKIALANSQVKEWVNKGAGIKNIEIVGDKAYVLVVPKEVPEIENEKIKTIKNKEFVGALIKIELKQNRISKIEGITPIGIPLTQKDRSETKKIVEKSNLSASVSEKSNGEKEKTIEFEKIESIPTYNLKLNKNGNEIEIVPEKTVNDEVRVTYEVNGEKRESVVNLEQRKIEEVKILEKDESFKE